MFWRKLRDVKLFRTLRFRLASTFLLLLTGVLAVVGLVGTQTLRTILENQSEAVLHDQLGAMKGYIHFDGQGNPIWFADTGDPEEEATVGRLKAVFVIANDRGDAWDGSPDPALKELFDRNGILSDLAQIEKAKEPLFKTIVGKDKVPYEVISSTMTDADLDRKWYVAEGRSLAADRLVLRRFRRNFFIFLPIALLACALVSWYSAGRVLESLQSVEKAAQEITGSNLGLQIQKRGADDELDRLIDSFNAMSGRLKASFEQMRQFSTDVSHELRTPLTAIQGQLEVALFTATRKEQLQEAIENALQDVERLANLVRALLLLSQSESGQIPMNKTVLDLRDLTGDLVDQFQIPAEASSIQLTHETRESILCEVDRTQIERVITNLLSNAIKYTPAGGWVRACAENQGASIRLVVEDSGVGIPKDHLPHIFNRFYRVPDPNPEKGLGLGLSFVASIVKAHSGEIQVHSEIGKGSRFEVILPAGAVRIRSETPVMQDRA
ncbi:MAG: HAMP domain-containing protein [Acidobacteriaceae bacterium]|nr:HAMP domain-containing protein [Acidobacteriaceae bacterium]MBV9294484.1 HAMP domain-containing protein [Acidobacteriaceae bacterium]